MVVNLSVIVFCKYSTGAVGTSVPTAHFLRFTTTAFLTSYLSGNILSDPSAK